MTSWCFHRIGNGRVMVPCKLLGNLRMEVENIFRSCRCCPVFQLSSFPPIQFQLTMLCSWSHLSIRNIIEFRMILGRRRWMGLLGQMKRTKKGLKPCSMPRAIQMRETNRTAKKLPGCCTCQLNQWVISRHWFSRGRKKRSGSYFGSTPPSQDASGIHEGFLGISEPKNGS